MAHNDRNEDRPVLMPKGPGPGGHHPGAFRGMQKIEKPNDTKGTLRRIWTYISVQKFWLLIALTFVGGSTLLGLLGPYLIALSIDKFISLGITEGLSIVLLAMVGVYVMAALTSYLGEFILIGISQKVIKNMRRDFFNRMIGYSLKFFDEHSNGELMSRLTNDIENINTTLSQSIAQLFSSVLSFTGVVIIMVMLNWQMAIVSMVTVPLIYTVVKFIGKYTRKNYKAQQTYLGELNGIIEENLTGLKVVKVFGKEEQVIEKFKEVNQSLKAASTRAEIFGGFMGPTMNLMNNIQFAIIAGTGGYLVVKGTMTVGLIAAFLNYSKQFGRPLMQLANTYNSIQSAIAGAERVFETMDHVLEMQDEPDAKVLNHVDGHVVFEAVDFGYNPEKKVLKKADFNAKPGDSIAIVGPTGAGKTTIINLLTRFYEIDSGSITVDGIDIRSIKKHSLRNKLGIVLQDTYLFSGTVRENIRYGRLNATDDEVEEAATRAYAHPFIRQLPEGYNTLLSQEGSNLSQGQRQLLAIARAILSDPAILILDEATSSVDTRTEINIQKAMLHLMEGRTSFVIAHRLSTIKDATMIMVINDGEIIERGSHKELLEMKGFYYNLHHTQYSALG
ncbi:MAG: ABC transporter ATP-binding protein [Sedimentibacter sp.]